MSWAAVAVGAVSLGVGIYQTVKSNNAKKDLKREDYVKPTEIATNSQTAEQIAYEGMPAASKNAFKREVQRSEAAMLNAQGSLNAGLSGLAAGSVAAMDAQSRLYVEDANMRRQGRQMQMQANQVTAQYKDREFAYGRQDYLEDRDWANAMAGAGQQNIMTGVDYAASGIAGAGFGNQRNQPVQNQGFSFGAGDQNLTNQLNTGNRLMSPSNPYAQPANDNLWMNQGDQFLYT